MRYKLVTFYPDYEIPKGDVWRVYGHLDIAVNESIGVYNTSAEAVIEAFKYGVPVMLGRSYDEVLIKLTTEAAS